MLATSLVPIYEYKCGSCDKQFEYMQRMSEDPKTVCEACGGALERLISASAFHLKGGGWYKDLYSSPKPGADAKSADSSSTDSAAGSTAGTSTGSDSGASGGTKSSDGGSSPSTPSTPTTPKKTGGSKASSD